MKIADAIREIKLSTHDAIDEYSEAHCLDFLNEAIQKASAILIAGNYLPLVKEVRLRHGGYLPHNFFKMCGQYPIKITAGRIEFLDEDRCTMKFRYFSSPELLTEDDSELPFNNDAINKAIVKTAIMLALNENEFDIQADSALMTEFQQAIAGGMM